MNAKPDKTILLVGAGNQTNSLITNFLRNFNFSVIPVRGANEAIQATRIQDIDVTVLGETSPETCSFELCEVLKTHPITASTPVIFLLPTNNPTSRDKSFMVGADAILSKPVDIGHLVPYIEQLT